MLVLEREVSQKILIGETLVIKVHDVEPRTVWVQLIAEHPLLCRPLEALRLDESLRIVEGIELTLISIRHCKYVALGINAPKHVRVHREEVSRRIAVEGLRA